MKISILLPYKENFSPNYPGAVSLFVDATTGPAIDEGIVVMYCIIISVY